eukprot:Amastigsp_a181961_5.p1 type:complete len:428 gc:universal Amastigsp_a181961_5:73-1356(+)
MAAERSDLDQVFVSLGFTDGSAVQGSFAVSSASGSAGAGGSAKTAVKTVFRRADCVRGAVLSLDARRRCLFVFVPAAPHTVLRLSLESVDRGVEVDEVAAVSVGPALPEDAIVRALHVHGNKLFASLNDSVVQLALDSSGSAVPNASWETVFYALEQPAGLLTVSWPLDDGLVRDVVVLCEMRGNRVLVADIQPDGTAARQPDALAGSGVFGVRDAPSGVRAQFQWPTAVCVSRERTAVFVGEYAAVRLVSLQNGATTTVAGSNVFGYVDAPSGDLSRFWDVLSLSIDSMGTLYVADSGNNAVRRIADGGATTTLAGTRLRLVGDGPVSRASFARLTNVATTASGTVLVTDGEGAMLRAIVGAAAPLLLYNFGCHNLLSKLMRLRLQTLLVLARGRSERLRMRGLGLQSFELALLAALFAWVVRADQ